MGGMDVLNRVEGPVGRFLRCGDAPDDSEDERLKHRFMLAFGSVMAMGGLVWGTLAAAYGLVIPAAIPLGYTVATIVNFVSFARRKNFPVAVAVQLAMTLCLPFFFQWSLGGFYASGAVMLWSVLALISSFAYAGRRTSYWVLVLFAVLTVVSGLIDSTLSEHAVGVAAGISTLFFVLNLGVVCSAVYLLTLFYVSELEQARRLQQAEQMNFLSTVSHELRTPLTSILGFNEMVTKKLERNVFPVVIDPDPKTQRAIEQIRMNLRIVDEESHRLTALINDVLDVTKLEAGAIEWKDQVVDVAALVDRAVKVCASLFRTDRVQLEVRVEDGLPALRGDEDRLLQVVINLVSNAAKFTSDGQVRITAASAIADGGPAIEIVVADSGHGIASGDLEKIFERFKQVGDTLTDKPQGTGLGLPISRHIVEHHGGRLWAESREGVGSRFHVLLPVGPTPVNRRPVGPASRVGRRILVVDDDQAILGLLQQCLETESHHVSRAASAEEALEQIRVAWPDLLIVDVALPGMSGLQLVHEVRTLDGGDRLPVIVISGVSPPVTGREGQGIDRFFAKPLDIDALRREVDEMLGIELTTVARPGGTILVVDDELTVRRLLREALENAGFLIEEAEDGRSALERARAVLPDLVLLDVVLPDVHGFDVAAALRADPLTADIPIITLSAVCDGADRIGVDRFFTKPIDLDALEAEIESLIDGGSTGPEPQPHLLAARKRATPDRET